MLRLLRQVLGTCSSSHLSLFSQSGHLLHCVLLPQDLHFSAPGSLGSVCHQISGTEYRLQKSMGHHAGVICMPCQVNVTYTKRSTGLCQTSVLLLRTIRTLLCASGRAPGGRTPVFQRSSSLDMMHRQAHTMMQCTVVWSCQQCLPLPPAGPFRRQYSVHS